MHTWLTGAAVLLTCFIVLQMPNAGHAAAVHYREAGISAQQALQQGYRVGQLLQAGYSPAEVVHSCQDLRWLRAGGVRYACGVWCDHTHGVQAWYARRGMLWNT